MALQEAGATILACADIEEAIVLRKAGVTAEILVFGALSVSDVAGVFDHNLTPTISTPGAGRSLQAAAATARRAAALSSEDRYGHEPAWSSATTISSSRCRSWSRARNLEIVAVYTHFATADDPDSPLFQTQRERFEQVLARLPQLGYQRRGCAMRRTARPRCAIRACGTTSSGRA